MTTAERDFSNHYAMFGNYSVITKMGERKWVVWQHPGVFKTRREASEAASRMFTSIR
jgi:hypothetical protein